LRNEPTAQLIELALRQTGDLVRAEASLATAELRADAVGALVATIAVMAGIVLFSLAVAFGVAAALLVSGVNLPVSLLATGAVLAALGGVTAIVSLRVVPRNVMVRSRQRVASKIRDIEDHAS
jgi:protein-S-isoprenylcysteine O-methyltransferase Ste14